MPTLGFRRGSYKCECIRGYYFPVKDPSVPKYFNGSEIEVQYEKKMRVSLHFHITRSLLTARLMFIMFDSSILYCIYLFRVSFLILPEDLKHYLTYPEC